MTEVLIGQTDYSKTVFIPDPASTDGSGKTGLVAANLTVSYTRVETDNDVVVTDVTSSLNDLAALTTAHTDWGIKEVSNTLAPGLYRIDFADAVFAPGAWTAVVYVMITTSAAAASPIEFELVAVDKLNATTFGLANLNATVSSRASQTSLDTVDDFLDTEVAAIKAKTDNLPADPADASDIAASFSTVNSTLSTIAGYIDTEVAATLAAVDTEVAAIKAKTDNLPAAPAAVGDIPTAVQNADAILDRDMSTGVDSGSPTVRTMRQALRFLRNKWSISGTTLTVCKEDDATASWTSVVTGTAGADPITANDPAGP